MIKKFCIAIAMSCAALTTPAQRPTITYSDFITGLSSPIDIVNAGDGSNRLFIVQQGGLIRLWEDNTLKNFLNMGPSGENLIVSGGEQGLLSMAFHPDFGSTSNYFFVYYTDLGGNLALRRYETMAGPGGAGPSIVANTTTDLLVMTISHPTNSNHNGAKLNFGPDGFLYFATGDGGGGNDGPNNAQTGTVLLGKMLRIDINGETAQPNGFYDIPASNPYVGDAAVRDEIWALGLRNPFRWSFDRLNGDMWIGDVGQGAREEINYRASANTAHVNYGWRCFEGHISTPSVADCTPVDNVFPVFDYNNPAIGQSAVTGGFVYRGSEFASLYGIYTAVDVYSDSLYMLWPNGSGGFDSLSQLPAGGPWFIVGFGEAEDGTLYAVSQGTGAILKVEAVGGIPLPVSLTSFQAQHYNGYNEITWNTATEENTARFIIEFSSNANSFLPVADVPASRNPNGSSYSYKHFTTISSTVYYRLAIQDDDGSTRYSSILRVGTGNANGFKIYPTLVRDKKINIQLSQPGKQLRMYNSSGKLVFEKLLDNITGTVNLDLPSLAKGIYIIQVTMNNEIKTGRIVIH